MGRTKQTGRKSIGKRRRERRLSPLELLRNQIETAMQDIQRNNMLFESDTTYIGLLNLAMEWELGVTEDSEAIDILQAMNLFEDYRDSFEQRLAEARQGYRESYIAARKEVVNMNEDRYPTAAETDELFASLRRSLDNGRVPATRQIKRLHKLLQRAHDAEDTISAYYGSLETLLDELCGPPPNKISRKEDDDDAAAGATGAANVPPSSALVM